jgi:hypothetical protein
MKFLAFLFVASLTQAADLQPLMALPDQIVLQDDFSKAGPLDKKAWAKRQGTQWTVEDGVFRGKPSTAEFQASKKDHKGLEPRLSAPITPPQFIAKFSVRFDGGSETAIVPFVEFGHHVCRVRFTKDGAEVLADGESTKVAESKDLKYEPGKWLHALAELKGDEFVIQFDGGPTIYAKHACFAKAVESGGNGLGLAGPKGGTVELDNVTLWSIKADAQPAWAAKRDALPKFEPVTLAKKKAQ